MNLEKNIQTLRKIINITQDELATRLSVSQQTISDWEQGTLQPEAEKLAELCEIFHCSTYQLQQNDWDFVNRAYSDIRIVIVEPFCYICYPVISPEPMEDAIAHVEDWAKYLNIEHPFIIGWDFLHISQIQKNVFHMHGYEAALILDANLNIGNINTKIISQNRQRYVTITLEEIPGKEHVLIPNAYNILLSYIAVNELKEKHEKGIISRYEHEYFDDEGVKFMDIYIAVEQK